MPRPSMNRPTIASLQQKINELNQTIRDNQKTIEELRNRLTQSDRIAAQQHQMVLVRDGRIKALEADLKDSKFKEQLHDAYIYRLRKVLDAALEHDVEVEVEWRVED